MTQCAPMAAKRLEGRLFVEQGRLYFVLEVDVAVQEARVSFQEGDGRKITSMPVVEIERKLAAAPQLQLDSLNSNESSARVVEREDGWYYSTRDGYQGPYGSNVAAHEALKDFIVRVQGSDEPRTERRN